MSKLLGAHVAARRCIDVCKKLSTLNHDAPTHFSLLQKNNARPKIGYWKNLLSEYVKRDSTTTKHANRPRVKKIRNETPHQAQRLSEPLLKTKLHEPVSEEQVTA